MMQGNNNNRRVDVLTILNKLGYADILPSSWYTQIDTWEDWYEGTTKFHHYSVYNGSQIVGCIRKSLGMAKKICEDKADLLLNEKVSITTQRQDYIDSVLDENNFWVRGNQLVELANALGTGAFVEYLDNGQPVIDYVTAPCIFPLIWQNGRVIECAFASVRNAGKKGEQTYLQRHLLESGRYVVYNNLYDKNGIECFLPDDVTEVWATGSPAPLFQIITPNIVNNISVDNPMGISIYANSIDVLEGIDLVYDSYLNEFRLGKKRIFVDDSVIKVDVKDGEIKRIFDPNDTVFYGLPGAFETGKAISESNMDLRVQDHQTALQSGLDMLSEKSGFGKGYYKFEADNVQTATAVISQNSKLYRKIRKDEIILEKALCDLVRALLFLGGHSPDTEISISFDDSIIEDTDAIAKRAMLELQAGVIDNVEYYKRVYRLEQEAAERLAQEIAERSPAPVNMDFFAEGEGGDA